MGESSVPGRELLEFPTDHIFKTMGMNRPDFVEDVRRAVSQVAPVARDALKTRESSGGKYLAVTVVVRLHNQSQLERIYLQLRQIRGVRYLL